MENSGGATGTGGIGGAGGEGGAGGAGGAGGTGGAGGGASAAISGSIEAKPAGALPNTVKLGAFTPARGSAQWRPKPFGGGTLTVRIDEDPSANPSRSLELTIYDDTGTPDAGESFVADSAGSFGLHRARLETYESDGGAWRTDGDGKVLVDAFDSQSVALTFQNVGQFAQAGGPTDVFIIEGAVTVPIVPIPPKATGVATLTLSNLGPEPGSNEPLNATSPGTPLSSIAVTHADVAYPYTGERRAVFFSDTVGSTTRNFRLAFPSGHLPRTGQMLPLNMFDRVQLTYFEGATLTEGGNEPVWEADHGTLVVDESSDTLLTVHLEGAGFQSESPTSKGVFDLNGQLTAPVAMP